MDLANYKLWPEVFKCSRVLKDASQALSNDPYTSFRDAIHRRGIRGGHPDKEPMFLGQLLKLRNAEFFASINV